MLDIIFLILVTGLVLFWLDSISKREEAVKHGKKLAKEFSLQLLDDTVHCSKIRIVRTTDNWPSLERIYFFYVSSNNENRIHCQLTLVGKKIIGWHIPPYPQ